MGKPADQDRLVAYPLRWPRWLADRAAQAANARAMSTAAWLREAALQKLERDGEKRQR